MRSDISISLRLAWRLAFIASLAVLLFGVWLNVSMAQHWTPSGKLPHHLRNPVLAMQMAEAPWPVGMLAPGRNMDEMTRQQYIDFGYIPSYALLFICIGMLQWRSDWRPQRRWIARLGPVSILLILVAAGFDVAENFAILGVTEQHNAAAWASIRPHAVVKWACAFLAILLESPFFLAVRDRLASFPRRLAGILGVATLVGGLFGLVSSIAGSALGIELATYPLLVSMLVMPPFLWLVSRQPH